MNEKEIELFDQLDPTQSILDLSTYPFLEKIISQKEQANQQEFCIPDTIPKLLSKAVDDPRYYYAITKLFSQWTRREVDLQFLSKLLLSENKLPNIKIKIIQMDDVDPEVYRYCYDNIVNKKLVVEFSPKFNILGDIIGKMLGYAKKTKTPLLMFNDKLVKLVKSIPVFLNNSLKVKQEFFSKRIPHLEYGRGVRFYLGIVLEMGTAVYSIPLASEAGYILMILDP
ncbi:hypothetical protein [Methanoregula sp.]|uniref:hypothetical protein n=1 Tax=Methanoregula sp. TaxID=2052170 RepID=UPI00356789F2